MSIWAYSDSRQTDAGVAPSLGIGHAAVRNPRGPESTRGFQVVRKGGEGRLFALDTNRIGCLAVNGVVTHLQGCLVYAQRHDERDHLEDDARHDTVVDDEAG